MMRAARRMRGGGKAKEMTTSGSTDFELDVSDYIEEAFERCGLEVRTGYDLQTAKRSLNLLLLIGLIAVLISGRLHSAHKQLQRLMETMILVLTL